MNLCYNTYAFLYTFFTCMWITYMFPFVSNIMTLYVNKKLTESELKVIKFSNWTFYGICLNILIYTIYMIMKFDAFSYTFGIVGIIIGLCSTFIYIVNIFFIYNNAFASIKNVIIVYIYHYLTIFTLSFTNISLSFPIFL